MFTPRQALSNALPPIRYQTQAPLGGKELLENHFNLKKGYTTPQIIQLFGSAEVARGHWEGYSHWEENAQKIAAYLKITLDTEASCGQAESFAPYYQLLTRWFPGIEAQVPILSAHTQQSNQASFADLTEMPATTQACYFALLKQGFFTDFAPADWGRLHGYLAYYEKHLATGGTDLFLDLIYHEMLRFIFQKSPRDQLYLEKHAEHYGVRAYLVLIAIENYDLTQITNPRWTQGDQYKIKPPGQHNARILLELLSSHTFLEFDTLIRQTFGDTTLDLANSLSEQATQMMCLFQSIVHNDFFGKSTGYDRMILHTNLLVLGVPHRLATEPNPDYKTNLYRLYAAMNPLPNHLITPAANLIFARVCTWHLPDDPKEKQTYMEKNVFTVLQAILTNPDILNGFAQRLQRNLAVTDQINSLLKGSPVTKLISNYLTYATSIAQDLSLFALPHAKWFLKNVEPFRGFILTSNKNHEIQRSTAKELLEQLGKINSKDLTQTIIDINQRIEQEEQTASPITRHIQDLIQHQVLPENTPGQLLIFAFCSDYFSMPGCFGNFSAFYADKARRRNPLGRTTEISKDLTTHITKMAVLFYAIFLETSLGGIDADFDQDTGVSTNTLLSENPSSGITARDKNTYHTEACYQLATQQYAERINDLANLLPNNIEKSSSTWTQIERIHRLFKTIGDEELKFLLFKHFDKFELMRRIMLDWHHLKEPGSNSGKAVKAPFLLAIWTHYDTMKKAAKAQQIPLFVYEDTAAAIGISQNESAKPLIWAIYHMQKGVRAQNSDQIVLWLKEEILPSNSGKTLKTLIYLDKQVLEVLLGDACYLPTMSTMFESIQEKFTKDLHQIMTDVQARAMRTEAMQTQISSKYTNAVAVAGHNIPIKTLNSQHSSGGHASKSSRHLGALSTSRFSSSHHLSNGSASPAAAAVSGSTSTLRSSSSPLLFSADSKAAAVATSSIPNIPGLTYKEVAGDGNCFYYAVALQISNESLEGRTLKDQAKHLREKTADSLQLNKDHYARFIRDDVHVSDKVAKCVAGIRRNQWAGDIEISVLTHYLQRPILVIHPDGRTDYLSQLEYYQNEIPIFAYYNGTNHYDALIPNYSMIEEIIKHITHMDNAARSQQTILNMRK